jgi:hypothetical protein
MTKTCVFLHICSVKNTSLNYEVASNTDVACHSNFKLVYARFWTCSSKPLTISLGKTVVQCRQRVSAELSTLDMIAVSLGSVLRASDDKWLAVPFFTLLLQIVFFDVDFFLANCSASLVHLHPPCFCANEKVHYKLFQQLHYYLVVSFFLHTEHRNFNESYMAQSVFHNVIKCRTIWFYLWEYDEIMVLSLLWLNS